MIYVMSDLHGQYEKYRAMLEKIEFSDKDELYIVGDIVDRGPKPVELLTDMSMRWNVYPLLGNHEMMAMLVLKKLCTEITAENYAHHLDAATLRTLAMWQADGGQTTLDGFQALSPDEREALLYYLEEFTPYEEITVRGRKFLLVHGGLAYDRRHLPLEEQSVGDLLTERPDYHRRYFEDVTLVTGHTPTLHIGGEYAGKIFIGNGHIALDCGAGFDMPLGCIRLDDLQTFYAV